MIEKIRRRLELFVTPDVLHPGNKYIVFPQGKRYPENTHVMGHFVEPVRVPESEELFYEWLKISLILTEEEQKKRNAEIEYRRQQDDEDRKDSCLRDSRAHWYATRKPKHNTPTYTVHLQKGSSVTVIDLEGEVRAPIVSFDQGGVRFPTSDPLLTYSQEQVVTIRWSSVDHSSLSDYDKDTWKELPVQKFLSKTLIQIPAGFTSHFRTSYGMLIQRFLDKMKERR